MDGSFLGLEKTEVLRVWEQPYVSHSLALSVSVGGLGHGALTSQVCF